MPNEEGTTPDMVPADRIVMPRKVERIACRHCGELIDKLTDCQWQALRGGVSITVRCANAQCKNHHGATLSPATYYG